MSVWKWVAAGFALSAISILAAIGFRSFQRRRDLAETLQWMDQTYNPHEGAENLGQGHGWEIHYVTNTKNHSETENERFQTTFSYNDSCRIVVHAETFAVGVFEDTPSTSTYTFDLRDIDPESIKIETFDPRKDVFNCADADEVQNYGLDCTSAEVEFQARNGSTAIVEDNLITFSKLQGKDHEVRNRSTTSKSWFAVDDAEYAKRFARALKHAVQLCGGQTSKF
jgi:hypothetical protein